RGYRAEEAAGHGAARLGDRREQEGKRQKHAKRWHKRAQPLILLRMRVALVHDFLLDVRGAERVFLTMADLWPEADVYTAVYDPRGTEFRFSGRPVNTTFLQKLRPTARSFRAFLPFYPLAIESLDLRGYDLVLSSSSAWSHGVIPGPGAVHVCYCHN